MSTERRRAALAALRLCEPQAKLAAVQALAAAPPPLDQDALLADPGDLPGRPPRPQLVPPAAVPQRSVHDARGLAALLHALAHIEFNAVNLALDALWRFGGMPPRYYDDWLRVASEEASHFELLHGLLERLGHVYGDFDAHDGLWQMAAKTRDDPLARMALVPRTLEARGLDATPPLQAKLRRVAHPVAAQAVGVLDVILRDEVGHVEIGNRWYAHLCAERGLDPVPTYALLARQYGAPRLRGPFNLAARRQAGFDAAELALLCGTSPPSDDPAQE
jgi:uncharacterized ferritin-like protein (DUF455 family)